MLLGLLCAAPASADRGGSGYLTLDGTEYAVRWDDGDSFRIDFGTRKGAKFRMLGYNTLEDYGPVHRWGGWKPAELFALAKKARLEAVSRRWTCTSSGKPDRYGRLLATCPDLAAHLVGAGLAMVFAVDGPADPKLLQLQLKAQQERAGMWLKGVPPKLVSSLHSADEERAESGKHAYNRVVDTETGAATPVPHDQEFKDCDWICAGPTDQQSCMLYVAFERRYGRNRPKCLRELAEP